MIRWRRIGSMRSNRGSCGRKLVVKDPDGVGEPRVGVRRGLVASMSADIRGLQRKTELVMAYTAPCSRRSSRSSSNSAARTTTSSRSRSRSSRSWRGAICHARTCSASSRRACSLALAPATDSLVAAVRPVLGTCHGGKGGEGGGVGWVGGEEVSGCSGGAGSGAGGGGVRWTVGRSGLLRVWRVRKARQ